MTRIILTWKGKAAGGSDGGVWYKTRWLELKKNHGMAPPPTYTDIDEAKTRLEIDRKLEQAGWVVQDKKKLNLHAALGVAVREMDMGAASSVPTGR